ncbi:hypothetical protein M758_UG144600, partial [Ceratodon purpureus]
MRHPYSYNEELAFNLLHILPLTKLPPVAQALIYIENLGEWYGYMHQEEPNNFPRFFIKCEEEELYIAIPAFLRTLPIQFRLPLDRIQDWRDLMQAERDKFQTRMSSKNNYFSSGNPLASDDYKISIQRRRTEKANTSLQMTAYIDWAHNRNSHPTYTWVDTQGTSHTEWAGPPVGHGTDNAGRKETEPYHYINATQTSSSQDASDLDKAPEAQPPLPQLVDPPPKEHTSPVTDPEPSAAPQEQ